MPHSRVAAVPNMVMMSMRVLKLGLLLAITLQVRQFQECTAQYQKPDNAQHKDSMLHCTGLPCMRCPLQWLTGGSLCSRKYISCRLEALKSVDIVAAWCGVAPTAAH